MRNDKNDRLFARNVRTHLKSDVNRFIKETYEKDPDKFWLGNNGIYIICKKAISEGNVYTLYYPSIINGSQTLHSVNKSSKDHLCRVLVRILQMDIMSNQQLLAEVIRRTNSQNTMKAVNLLAHDPFQTNVARYLSQYKLFYERREREWQNEKKNVLNDYLNVNIKDVTQWLSTVHPDIGLGTARGGFNKLFQEEFYPILFGSFDSQFKSLEYKNLVCVVWGGLFFRNFLKAVSKKLRSRFKFAHLLFIKAICSAIQNEEKLYILIKSKLENHEVGKKKCPQKIAKYLQNAMKKLKRVQKQEEKRNPNIDFTNFFKRNDSTLLAYRKTFPANAIKTLSSLIKKNINKIK